MFSKILIFLIFLNLNQLISSNEFIESNVSSDHNKNLSFKDTEYLEFKYYEKTKGKNVRPKLECEEEVNQKKLCDQFKVSYANCTNLNYQKSELPEWNCDFKDLQFKVSVYHKELNCEYVNEKSNDLPRFFKNDTCYLIYRLELNKKYVKSFRETSHVNFIENELTAGTNPKQQLFCNNKDPYGTNFCEDYHYKNVNCTNLNYQKKDFAKWKCNFEPLSPRIVTEPYEQIYCEYIESPDQIFPKYHDYVINSCWLSYEIAFNQDFIEKIYETPYLNFKSDLKTEGANPKPQLQCEEKSTKHLCDNYSIQNANCTNLNYEKLIFFNFACDFKNLSPDVEVVHQEVNCNYITTRNWLSTFEKGSCYLRYSLESLIIDYKETNLLIFKWNKETTGENPKKQLLCSNDMDLCKSHYAQEIKCINSNYKMTHYPKWNCRSNDLKSVVKIKPNFEIECKHTNQNSSYRKNTCQLKYELELNSDNVKEFIKTSNLLFKSNQLTKGDKPTDQLKCKEKQTSELLCSRYAVKEVECKNLNYEKNLNSPKWFCNFKGLNSDVDSHFSTIQCNNFSTKGILTHYEKDTCYLEYNLKLKQIEDQKPIADTKKNSDLYIYILIFVFIVFFLLGIWICYMISKEPHSDEDCDFCREVGMRCCCELTFCCFFSMLSNSHSHHNFSSSTSGLASTSMRDASSGIASTSFR